MSIPPRPLLTFLARALLLSAYGAVASAPVTIVVLTGPGPGARDPLSAFANDLILLVFPLLALQPVLAARLKLLDRLFGLDVVYLFHKIMGMTTGAALACVPFFLLAGGQGHSWKVLTGIGGAALLVALVLTALLFRELRMGFEAWRRLHNGLALAALVLIFNHGLFLDEVRGAGPVLTLWVLLFAAAAAAYGYHKLAGPASRGKHPYRVERVVRETHNVWTLVLAPPEGMTRFDYLPGQFQFLTFFRDGRRSEEHPFTISSSPVQEDFHTATIKASGDFTRTIGDMRAGDLVAVQAPYGRFSYLLHPEERELVFIAGGVGITPLMSMLRHMRDTAADKDVLLLYGNVTERDIVFRDELEKTASGERPRLRVVHVLSKAGPAWQGERGHIDGAVVRKYCHGGLLTKSFYVCGPPAMMTALIAAIIELGVPSRRVRSERFAL